ncbi:hypothetical protein [Marmot herpesvirus 1]|nr:hypothetical protein [Marmot herpesvirus 1]
MLPLFVLLLLAPVTGTTYVKVGDTLTLTADHLPQQGTFFWSRSRSWDPSRRDEIATSGNCTLRPYYGDRLTTCGQTLTLTNITVHDAATYYARVRGDGGNRWQNFTVQVFDSQPVLSPMLMRRTHIYLRCDDLKNPKARTYIEDQPKKHPLFQGVWNHDHGPYYTLHMREPTEMRETARCCSNYKNITTCGPWTNIDHLYYLTSYMTGSRPWCAAKGGHEIDKFSFNHVHYGNLHRGKCYRHTFAIPSEKDLLLCQENETTVITAVPHRGKWTKKRDFGGIHTVTTGSRWEIPFPTQNLTGNYSLVSNNTSIKFHITVLPELQASIEVVAIEADHMALKCAHNGRPGTKVMWTVQGTYGKFDIRDDILYVYPDCWKSYFEWYYKFGVLCKARDGPWDVYSRWFLAETTREDGDWCPPYCDDK